MVARTCEVFVCLGDKRDRLSVRQVFFSFAWNAGLLVRADRQLARL